MVCHYMQLCRAIMLFSNFWVIIFLLMPCNAYKKKEDKTKCPEVKEARNFDINAILGSWYVVQYYATSEEDLVYSCMRAVFFMPDEGMELDMNFTYNFADDPSHEILVGNITWTVPNPEQPAHWVHAEDSYEGVYNTFVLDFNENEWALLLHCAEKPKSPRYLTSLMLSKNTTLQPGVVSFLRDKLPRYDITLDYMFEMKQTECQDPSKNLHYASTNPSKAKKVKHPLNRKTRFVRNRDEFKKKNVTKSL